MPRGHWAAGVAGRLVAAGLATPPAGGFPDRVAHVVKQKALGLSRGRKGSWADRDPAHRAVERGCRLSRLAGPCTDREAGAAKGDPRARERRDRLSHHKPAAGQGRPRTTARPRSRPLGHRKPTASCPRRLLQRGSLPLTRRSKAARHTAQPRHRPHTPLPCPDTRSPRKLPRKPKRRNTRRYKSLSLNDPVPTLVGSRQWSCLSSFPYRSRTRAPSLRRRYPASPVLRAHPPPCRPSLPLAGVRLVCAHHRQGFPCCYPPPLPCVPPPLPRRNRPVLVSLASQPVAAFPAIRSGRLPHCTFRGLLGVHSRCGPHGRQAAQGSLFHRSASGHVVASIARSDCYRLERQLPGGIRTR